MEECPRCGWRCGEYESVCDMCGYKFGSYYDHDADHWKDNEVDRKYNG